MPILEARGLRRSYADKVTVDLQQLGVEAQEVLAILGPNGSGKSTLFRLLLLLEPADAGCILLEGKPLDDRTARRRMAAVFQHPYLFAGTVADNVGYGLRVRGAPAADRSRRTEEAMADLGLSAIRHRRIDGLSGGERQRVALARALACNTDILLFDEPTSALDVTTQRSFREDLSRVVRARGLSVILITHDPGDAFALADRIAVLEQGRIAQVGTPLELLTQPRTSFVAAFTGAELLLNGVIAEITDELVGIRLASGALMWAAQADAPQVGQRVNVSYQPDDVALSPATSGFESSARNVFTLTVESVTASGPLVRVTLNGSVRLASVITRRSAEELRIGPGARVHAHLKAAALRAFTVGS